MEELLTVQQVSQNLKLSKMTIYRYIKSLRLEAIKMGRDFRIRQSELDKFLKENKHK